MAIPQLLRQNLREFHAVLAPRLVQAVRFGDANDRKRAFFPNEPILERLQNGWKWLIHNTLWMRKVAREIGFVLETNPFARPPQNQSVRLKDLEHWEFHRI